MARKIYYSKEDRAEWLKAGGTRSADEALKGRASHFPVVPPPEPAESKRRRPRCAVSTKKPPPPPQQPGALIGLYGHAYTGRKDERTIRFRFQVIRKLDGERSQTRYLVQYFSFVDGTPNHVGVYTEYELLGPGVKLYLSEATWNAACEQDSAPQDLAEDIGDEAAQ